jgi:hypothetical protein
MSAADLAMGTNRPWASASILDGARVGRGMLGVEHDEVEAGQPEDLNQGPDER